MKFALGTLLSLTLLTTICVSAFANENPVASDKEILFVQAGWGLKATNRADQMAEFAQQCFRFAEENGGQLKGLANVDLSTASNGTTYGTGNCVLARCLNRKVIKTPEESCQN